MAKEKEKAKVENIFDFEAELAAKKEEKPTTPSAEHKKDIEIALLKQEVEHQKEMNKALAKLKKAETVAHSVGPGQEVAQGNTSFVNPQVIPADLIVQSGRKAFSNAIKAAKDSTKREFAWNDMLEKSYPGGHSIFYNYVIYNFGYKHVDEDMLAREIAALKKDKNLSGADYNIAVAKAVETLRGKTYIPETHFDDISQMIVPNKKGSHFVQVVHGGGKNAAALEALNTKKQHIFKG